MSLPLETWIETRYDDLLRSQRDGMKAADAYAQLIPDLVADVAAGNVNLAEDHNAEWAARVIRQHMSPIRRSRSRKLTSVMEFVNDALADPSGGATIWGFADTPYSTGHPDGIDKALRFWLPDDVDMWIDVRMQKARDTVAAAQIDAEVGQQFKANLSRFRVPMLDSLSPQVAVA